MKRYDIKAKGDSRAELLIYGDIGASWWEEESNDAKTVVSKLQELRGRDIDVRINSFGGAVSDGLAIFNALKRHDGEVIAHIDGVAYSVASLIAMAGHEVRIAGNGMLMVHAPWGMSVGNAPEMRDMADMLDKHAEAMISSYLRDGGPDEATVRAWLTDGDDHYFTASEAIEAGLADVTTEQEPITQIAAALKRADRTYTLPAAMRRTQQPETSPMANDPKTPGDSPKTPDLDQHSRTVQAAQAAGVKAEATRRKAVGEVFAGFDNGDPLDPVAALHAQCMEDTTCDELEARRRLLAALAHKSADPILAQQAYNVPSNPSAPPNVSRHIGGIVQAGPMQDEKVYKAMQDAVSFRMGYGKDIDVGQNPYVGLSTPELAREFARAAGIGGVAMASADMVVSHLISPQHNVRLNVGGPDIRAMHSSGDFPGLYLNVIDKAIRIAYEQAAETWPAVVYVTEVNDFKQAARPAPTAMSDLEKIPEGGEYKGMTGADVVEYLQAEKWGGKFAITREMLLGDDLAAMQRAAIRMASSAARKVGDEVYNGIYIGNPTLNQDATQVFHADHKNIGTAGGPDTASLSEARKLMRLQKDPSGNATLNLAPALLITSPVWETEARALVGAEQLDYELAGDSESSQIVNKRAANQFSGLQVVVEPRLAGADGNGTDWFLQANPTMPVPFVELAFVRGQRTPYIASREGWDIDGMEYKVRQEFKAIPLAYQPCIYNAGA